MKTKKGLLSDTIISTPGNTQPAETVWAWLSVDEQGNEGIVANPMPFISQFKSNMNKVLPIIEELRRDPRAKGYTFVLAQFKRVR